MSQTLDRDEPRRAAEAAARASYGRLVAILAARSGDIAGAEDALGGAFAAALATWPERGVPDNPAAWLLTTARRKMQNHHRHRVVEARGDVEQLLRDEEIAALARAAHGDSDWAIRDERLELLFVCAHPAIDEAVRTPLMLQTVLGLDAERIASAFLIAPKTMGQRLVRAKTKIKATALRFRVPDAAELPGRLLDVLAAIYAAYGAGWDDVGGAGGRGLTEEALFLGRLVATLLPEEPEALGLVALMLFCESRRDARRDDNGCFVPLVEQDVTRWSRDMIIEADALLIKASRAKRFGRFQCEAAIQSVHAQRALTGVVQHAALRLLYDLLLAHEPSVGVAVGRAAALLDGGDAPAALAALDALDPDEVASYQPYWVTRARLAERTNDPTTARRCLDRALGLTEDPAVRAFLARRGRMPAPMA